MNPVQGVRHFLLALQFFTRIPVTGRLAQWVGYSPAMLRASAGHFPGVGWLVGAVGALVLWGALRVLPGGALGALVAAAFSTLATVWLTGAFHEDGMADTADGLGGAVTRERALAIMKDSRIGTYGAAALVLVLALKLALLALLALGIRYALQPAVATHFILQQAGKALGLQRPEADRKPVQRTGAHQGQRLAGARHLQRQRTAQIGAALAHGGKADLAAFFGGHTQVGQAGHGGSGGQRGPTGDQLSHRDARG